MQTDFEYYEALYRRTNNPRNDESAPAGQTRRGGTGGAALRASGRGRGRGPALGRTAVREGVKLPSVNDYGRQTASSAESSYEKGGHYPDPKPPPSKRGRTGMTEMLYGEDLMSDDEGQELAKRSKRPNSQKLLAASGVPELLERDDVDMAFEDTTPTGFPIPLQSDPSSSSEPDRRTKYTQEQLRGPATASGLPAFPHRSAPQETPLISVSTKPSEAASGPTHVDYIREFAASDLGPKIAYAIMERERPPPPFCEARGCSQSPTWRCDSCDEGRYQCKACLSSSHASTPYHRVKWFNGEFYEDAWLRDAGVLLVLCPNSSGLPCKSSPSKPELPNGFWDAAPPSYAFSVSTSDIYSPAESEAFDSTSGAHPVDQPERHLGSDALDEGEVEGCPAFEDGFSRPSPQSSSPLGTGRARTCSSVELDPRGLHVVTICHENGIHGLGVQFCVCPGAPERDMQLVAKGIYPASRKNPTTGFTFRCLDRFFIDNLEGDTSAECFARKLQRLTAPDNPDSAPNRYPELLRCGREYRIVIQLAEHGFAHQDLRSWEAPGQGDLLYDCVVCPNPDENMRTGWDKRKDKWAHFYSYNIDGNFEGQHNTSRVPDNNQPLYPGTGAFNHPEDAARALERGRDDKQLPQSQKDRAGPIPCHDHRAASNIGKSRNPTTDIQGIGAIVCARHGCFCAGATNNFSLGETQIPIDHSLNNVFKRCDFSRIKKLQILYDINCQYSVHLEDRFKAAGYDWPDLERIMLGVGVWHIYGHVLECFSRFSPLFAYRCGIVDGEIVETLWSILNHILGSCRGMSLAHREETINFKIRDMNWKKIIKSVDALVHRVKKFTPLLDKRIAYLAKISENCSEEDMNQWDNLRKEIEDKRSQPMPSEERRPDRQDDRGPRFVDHRLDTIEEAPSSAAVEAELLEEEAKREDDLQLVRPIATAMKLQAEQINLQIIARQPAGTEEVRLERERWRARLASAIGRSNATMARLLDSLGDQHGGPIDVVDPPLPPVSLDHSFWQKTASEPSGHDTRPRAEHRSIDLPSSRWNGEKQHTILNTLQKRALEIECRLRQAEANVILHKLRITLVDQAYTYRKEIRSHTAGYNRANLARLKTQAQGHVVRQQAQLYTVCRSRMLRCCSGKAAVDGLGLRYRLLRESEIRCDTSTYDPTGSQLFELPWFWRLDRKAGEDDDTYVSKTFMVRWIQARCAVERCKEELIILPLEMERCIMGYRHQAGKWHDRSAKSELSPGHRCYALRKSNIWSKLASHGEQRFLTVLGPDILFSSE